MSYASLRRRRRRRKKEEKVEHKQNEEIIVLAVTWTKSGHFIKIIGIQFIFHMLCSADSLEVESESKKNWISKCMGGIQKPEQSL